MNCSVDTQWIKRPLRLTNHGNLRAKPQGRKSSIRILPRRFVARPLVGPRVNKRLRHQRFISVLLPPLIWQRPHRLTRQMRTVVAYQKTYILDHQRIHNLILIETGKKFSTVSLFP